MGTTTFSISGFISADKPWTYLEQCGLHEEVFPVTANQCDALLNLMDTLDEVHLSYALVIARRQCPGKFAMVAASLLAHESMSVRLNAYNLLSDLSREEFSGPIQDAVTEALNKCPEEKHFADLLSTNRS